MERGQRCAQALLHFGDDQEISAQQLTCGIRSGVEDAPEAARTLAVTRPKRGVTSPRSSEGVDPASTVYP